MKKLLLKSLSSQIARIPETRWYDIKYDWHLIEASFAKQYAIRLRENKKMPFSEFQQLLSGLMSDTPLGNIISIRSETDKEALKNFTPQMREERSKWLNMLAEEQLKDPEKLDKQMKSLERMFESMFSNK